MNRHVRPWLLAVLALPFLGCGESAPSVVVPKSTTFTVTLGSTLSTESSRVGDRIVATLVEPVVVDGVTVAPAGTELGGRLTAAKAAGKFKGRSRLAFVLEEIVLDGKKLPISASAIDLSGASQTKKNAAAIGGGAGAGAVVGAIAGGKKGAAIGAAVGGGVGTGAAALKGGQQIVLPAGQPVTVELTAPFSVN